MSSRPTSPAPAEMPSILRRILQDRQLQVKLARKRVGWSELRERAREREPRDFLAALRRGGAGLAPAVIAELKRASPSRGRLREDFDIPTLATGYEMAGAAALSVLTEEDHFEGQLEYLAMARRATRLPILRKDFLFTPYQIWESAAAGADAVLLIVAMLGDAVLKRMLSTARSAGLAAMVEVHDAAELHRALEAGADCIGVNNRDLHTFRVDVNTALDLARQIPAGVLAVAESGLRTGADLVRMHQAGYRAVLVGEHFMQSPDPGFALTRMLGEVPAAPAGSGFIKICGLTNLADARAACAAGADAIGFVFAESPRRISPEQARAISAEIPVDVLRVGVFAGESLTQVRQIAASCGLSAVQLHGPYAPGDGRRLAQELPVWRALAMPLDLPRALAWAGHSERFLLDTAVAGRLGGTGVSFDWNSARLLPAAIPPAHLIVAGGLRPGNVAEAIRRSGAGGVDVSSGVELQPGRKNHEAVASFIAAARQAFAEQARAVQTQA